MSAEPRASDLTAEDRALLARGVEEFNAGLFLECHDTLEEVWSGLRGPSRDFMQGLIQVAVGFYHLGNGNRGGASTLFRRALGRLEKYGDAHAGIDLRALRPEVAAWLARAEGPAPLPAGVALESLPKIVPSPGPDGRDGHA